MAEPFLGQIIMSGFNFAPRGYAQCNGQLLSIAQNTALFSLLGTQFGGNGQTNFALPDLRGRAPLHQGQGPGLSSYTMGESAGEENHTLISTEMPSHNHVLSAVSGPGSSSGPSGNYIAASSSRDSQYSSSPPDTTMNAQEIGAAGGSQPHNNMQPFLVVNFAIAMEGIYPSQT